MDKTPDPEFKIAERREDGTVIAQMEDGRMFPVAVAEGVELRKGSKVGLKFAESDKDGVPVDATVTKVL